MQALQGWFEGVRLWWHQLRSYTRIYGAGGALKLSLPNLLWFEIVQPPVFHRLSLQLFPPSNHLLVSSEVDISRSNVVQ